VGLGLRYRLTPQSRAAAVAAVYVAQAKVAPTHDSTASDSTVNVSAANIAPADVSATHIVPAQAEPNNAVPNNAELNNVATSSVSPTAASPTHASMAAVPSLADSPMSAVDAPSIPPVHLPNAMAHNASSPRVKPSQLRVTISGRAPQKLEVIIRVSVDRQGRGQAFNVVQGDEQKIAAAMKAARRWSFKPCASEADCEHLLKFTDYGDASFVQVID
jgi:hypothetical protein